MGIFKPNSTHLIGGGDLATLFGVTDESVRQMRARGVITPASEGRGKYPLIAVCAEYTLHLREKAAGRDVPRDMNEARLKKLKAEAISAELKADAARGLLIPAAEIENRWATVGRIVRASLLAVPNRVAARMNLTNMARQELEAELHDAMAELAEHGLEKVKSDASN